MGARALQASPPSMNPFSEGHIELISSAEIRVTLKKQLMASARDLGLQTSCTLAASRGSGSWECSSSYQWIYEHTYIGL